MIKLKVVGLRGAPLATPKWAQFGADGGSIGRAESNALVLDDPDRTVSRVHAQLICRNGRFVVIDRGSNPMTHNGSPLGAGKEAMLAGGDRLTIGGFELSVEEVGGDAVAAGAGAFAGAARPSDDDPFADLLVGLTPGSASTPAASSPVQRASASSLPSPDPGHSARATAVSSPGAQGGAAPGLPADPFEDLLAGPMPGRAGGSADTDPFADLFAPVDAQAQARGGASATAGAGGGFGAAPAAGRGALDDFSDLAARPAGKAAGIDDLFGGLGGLSGVGGAGSDPLALSPLADPLRQPNTAGSADPFAALQGQGFSTPAAPPRNDHLPIGQFGFVPPAAAPGGGGGLLDLPGAPVAVPAPAATPAVSSTPPPVASKTAPSTAADVPASPDALMAALLRGLGSSHQMPHQLTPALMERIGVLLRTATEGTLQLLLTRQEFKRELRAEVTMIASEANNPLKFSPTAEVALAHLMGPGIRGFMPAEAAMRDAFDDLRAHQFGVMVGMRAALAQVIERFAPDELEKKIAARSALDSLFAANRKARLWDQFIALYGGIASEAEDDFHALFGRAFLQAYEEQMKRLKSTGN
ncbi:MAG: type VI secretion system-associated FHA domain protein TagH [Gammaproteobacteria bacterium]|nr:type VI secretion system-associated FHA domain protein TagH [Gammaproteobacteria bacterium]